MRACVYKRIYCRRRRCQGTRNAHTRATRTHGSHTRTLAHGKTRLHARARTHVLAQSSHTRTPSLHLNRTPTGYRYNIILLFCDDRGRVCHYGFFFSLLSRRRDIIIHFNVRLHCVHEQQRQPHFFLNHFHLVSRSWATSACAHHSSYVDRNTLFDGGEIWLIFYFFSPSPVAGGLKVKISHKNVQYLNGPNVVIYSIRC